MTELYHAFILVGSSALAVFLFFVTFIILQAESRLRRTNKKTQDVLDNCQPCENMCSNVYFVYTNKGEKKKLNDKNKRKL
tara:strand:- start:3691 stop:3930 length:240 start_codon:yes stop_codon:yes gene_type:complete